MIVYTKNRRTTLCDEGGQPKQPAIELAPMTRVDLPVIKKFVDVGSCRWVHVTVIGPPHTGQVGWVPAAALTKDAQNALFALSMGTTAPTGSAYGSEKSTWAGQVIMVADKGAAMPAAAAAAPAAAGAGDLAPQQMLWQSNCPQCGYDRRSHRIPETGTSGGGAWVKPRTTKPSADQAKLRTAMVNAPRGVGTRDDAATLYQAVLAGLSGKTIKGFFGKIMLGVAHVAESDNVYAAHSGVTIIEPIKAICKELGSIYMGKPNPSDNGKKFRTRGGSQISQITIEDLSACAAPKLLHGAIRAGEYPCAMTEVWYDPEQTNTEYPDRHTIESCDACRSTIPFLLCPE